MDTLASLRDWVERLLFPDLAQIPPTKRAAALDRARAEPLEFIETAGILAAIVTATAFTRYDLKDALAIDWIAAALLNFAAAVPLLVVLVGPFLVRRTRRGLRAFIGEKGRRG